MRGFDTFGASPLKDVVSENTDRFAFLDGFIVCSFLRFDLGRID